MCPSGVISTYLPQNARQSASSLYRVRPVLSGNYCVSTEGGARGPRSNSLTAGHCVTLEVLNVTIIEVIIEMKIFREKTLVKGNFPRPWAIHRSDQIPIFEVPYKYTKNSLRGCYVF